MGPLITLKVHEQMKLAIRAGRRALQCSLDLDRSITTIELGNASWRWQARDYPYLEVCKDRTIYYWNDGFVPAARYATSLIKLVPTVWGPPTFEIDGIKMLPTAKVSPLADAQRKVNLIQPQGKTVLDTCGGLGYFAACCLDGQVGHVRSFEKSADVIWLRSINPWSPQSQDHEARLTLTHADVIQHLVNLPAESFDAVLHDPPRFGIAGELYSQSFYDHLARVLKRRGRLFHYTGSPNKLSSGRDVPNEVANRLRRAGFSTELNGDGVLAVKGAGLAR